MEGLGTSKEKLLFSQIFLEIWMLSEQAGITDPQKKSYLAKFDFSLGP